MHARQILGQRGEDLVARWYERRGGVVLARNWRHGRTGELDLIVSWAGSIIICEVKTRATTYYGQPAEAVGWEKQRRVRRLAALWLVEHPTRARVRFDVASVVGDEITVIESAF